MIAAIDIGNTRTKFALFRANGELVKQESCSTSAALPSLEFFQGFEKSIIGSVVPAKTSEWLSLFPSAHVVNHESPFRFKNLTEEPSKVGVDRLLNLEALVKTPGAVLVVDAGTATKFDLLEGVDNKSFPGGVIAPGMGISYEALVARAAQLPEIDLAKFSPVIGYNTETAIRSGVVHGFAAMVDGMIMKIMEERGLASITSVIATGGYSNFLKSRSRFITQYKPNLTLEGLFAMAKNLEAV